MLLAMRRASSIVSRCVGVSSRQETARAYLLFHRAGKGGATCSKPRRVQAPLRRSPYQRAMLIAEWSLLVLDVIGAAALGTGLIILIRRRGARYPHH